MPKAKREKLTGRRAVGKTAVAGIKDRHTKQASARAVANTKSETVRPFIIEHVKPATNVYTDDALTYQHLPNHDTVKHSVGENVRGMAHTNDMENFWSMLKRAHMGTFHKISPKHVQRYVNEFSGRHNIREANTEDHMDMVAVGMLGKRLRYQYLITDNGLDNGSRTVCGVLS